MKPLIFKYQPENKNEILLIWEKSVLATHDFLSRKDFIEIKEMLQNFDFKELNVFCQIVQNKIVGFIGLNSSKIEMLFLDPNYIGKGLGKNLMNFAVVNHNANLVDVNEQNTHAKNFYEKYGFEVYERTEKDNLGKDYPILKMKLTENWKFRS